MNRNRFNSLYVEVDGNVSCFAITPRCTAQASASKIMGHIKPGTLHYVEKTNTEKKVSK